MTRFLPEAAFAAGLAAICWVGNGYVGTSPLALAVTALIGVFYLVGGAELRRFSQSTAGLARALGNLRETPAALGAWLDRVPAALRQPVRLRIEGERAGLPGPALTPYLAGLLVLLGMLGTFLGMVVTLRGTGTALEGASDLATIRASLSAPVQGLGLAFGTSIAGVAASAMLGLASALCRRDRMVAAAALDGQIATRLRVFGPAHRRDEWFRLQQEQAHALPALVERVGAMASALERRSEALDARLLAVQSQFHDRTDAAYAGLAAAVDRSLKESLADSARIAGATLQPAVEAAMAGLARESQALHQAVEHGVNRQLASVTSRFAADAAAVADHWQRALEAHARTGADLSAAFGGTLDRFGQTFDERAGTLVARVSQDTQQALTAASDAFEQHTAALVRHATQHLAEVRAETADAIADLRRQLSEGLARDNAMLGERSRLLAMLDAVLGAVHHNATAQRASIDALVASSGDLLGRAGERFAAQIEAHGQSLDAASAQVAASAVEVASLGESFGAAVQLFGQTSAQLGAQLQRIDAALAQSTARSDEQLAYYVAQARELIDLSLLSQKQIVDEMHRVASRREPSGVAA